MLKINAENSMATIGMNHTTSRIPDKKKGTSSEPVDSFTRTEITTADTPAVNIENQPPISSQRQSEHLGTDENGRISMTNVRWGFEETSAQNRWKPIFKNTQVDPGKLKDVYFVLIHRGANAQWMSPHGIMMYEFEDGGVKSGDGQSENGLVLSVEVEKALGQKLSAVGTLDRSYPIYYQLGTWKDTVQKVTRNRGNSLIRYKLNLSPEQKQELLKVSLDETFKDHGNDRYQLINNSCVNNQMRMLNMVLPHEQKITENLIPDLLKNPLASIPNSAPRTLFSKGLIGDSAPIITEPDTKLHPGNKTRRKIKSIIRKMSDWEEWPAISRISGSVAGAVLGSLVLPTGVGIAIGGILGAEAGEKSGEYMKWSSHTQSEPCEKYFS